MTDVQYIELQLYKAVADLCNKHSLRHYAIGGTLLGAVRHKGFIPWDDDIDIAIPRPDYDLFVQFAKSELPAYIETISYEETEDNIRPTYFARVRDTRTSVALHWANKEEISPLWVDIFPLDAMPTDPIKRVLQKYRLLYARMKVQFSIFDVAVHQHRNRPPHERALIKFRELTGCGSDWDAYELYTQAEHIAREYSYEHENYVANIFGAYKFREMWPKAWFGDPVMLPFEDIEMSCPSAYGNVLAQLYGDYMQLPPESERGLQHSMEIITLGEARS